MRARLIVVFTAPIVLLFLFLGAVYAPSLAYSEQQALFLDRLSDTSHFAMGARQALATDDPTAVEAELLRYLEVYGIGAAVLDRVGDVWASNGMDVTLLDESSMLSVHAALSGRRSEMPAMRFPWSYGDLVVAEPVFDGGDLVGVVLTSSETAQLRGVVLRQWLLLFVGGLVAVLASVLLASRLANWVLRPVRMVDNAMTEIWKGHMEARISQTGGPPELRRVVTVFNNMAEQVEHLIHQQQEFVANASHELRNPLSALLLRVEHLAMGLGSEWDGDVERAREEGNRMARILDALLMLARGQGGEDTSPVDLVALVHRRMEAWRPISTEHDVRVRLMTDNSVRCAVDEIMMESAFDAVFDNAVKFSPRGGLIEVSVAQNADQVEVSVRDQGPGLPEEDLQRATDRFWRSAQHQNTSGSGLGLAIATEFLESCGGHLDVRSGQPEGLEVVLRVPTYREPL